MTARALQALAVALACGALLGAGCGDSDEPQGTPLPRETANQLQERLGEIERRYRDGLEDGNVGACEDIDSDSFPAVNELIAGLPQDVDPELRRAVDDSFANLHELTRGGCADVEPPEPTTPEPEPEPLPEPDLPPEPTAPEPTVPQDDEEDDGGQGGSPAPPGLNGDVPPGQDGAPPGRGGGQQAPEADG